MLEAKGGKCMTVRLAIVGTDGKEACGLTLFADGRVDFHGADLLFRGQSLLVQAKTQIAGSLDVKEKKR